MSSILRVFLAWHYSHLPGGSSEGRGSRPSALGVRRRWRNPTNELQTFGDNLIMYANHKIRSHIVFSYSWLTNTGLPIRVMSITKQYYTPKIYDNHDISPEKRQRNSSPGLPEPGYCKTVLAGGCRGNVVGELNGDAYLAAYLSLHRR